MAGVPLAVVVAGFEVSPILVLIVLALSICLLRRPMSTRSAIVVAALVGGLAAIEVLVKLNAGVIALALGAVAVACHPMRRRLVPVFGGAAVLLASAAWLATGQSPTALPSFVAGAVGITSGYSEAMGFETDEGTWQYAAAAVTAVLGVVAALATRRGDQVRDVGTVVLWVLFAFGSFKAGFVRHDDGHGRIFFLSCVVGLAVMGWQRGQRGIALATLAIPTIGVLALTPSSTFGPLDPAGDLSDAEDALGAVVSAERREEIAATGRSAVATGTDVPPDLLAGARKAGPTAVWPYELSVAWLGDLQFRPLPLLQDYQAYSPALNRRDAELLADPARAPSAVLLQASEGIVDGRRRAYNAPLAVRELTCRYRPASSSTELWMLVLRSANRCRRPMRTTSTRRVAWNEPVRVPAPRAPSSQVLMAVDGLQVRGTERLRTAVFRAHDRRVVVGSDVQRVVPSLASEPALVRAGEQADFPGGQALAPGPTTVRFERDGDVPRGSVLRVTFFEQQVDP